MGFTINEAIEVPRLGVSVSNAYVTIKGSYQYQKIIANIVGIPTNENSPYVLVANYYIYKQNDATLVPLHQEHVRIGVADLPANPFTTIYNHIKTEKFAGKTFVDV
jgi:hypothetical protein